MKLKLDAGYLIFGAVLLAVLAGMVYQYYFLPTQATPSLKSETSLTAAKASNVSVPTNTTLPPAAQLTGKPSCSTGKLKVFLFTDPYCPACAANDFIVNKFYEKYSGKADVSYKFVVTYSRQLALQYGRDEVYQSFDYFVCAEEQRKTQEFKDCFYDKLMNDGVDYVPVKFAELQECAVQAGIDEDKLIACIPTARNKLDESLKEAADFGGGTFFTPMTVIDCQYRVNSALTEQTYCAVTKTC